MVLPLLHSPAKIVQLTLIGSTICSDPLILGANNKPAGAWPVYAQGEPDSPDECVTVRNTQGLTEGRTMVDGEPLDHFGIQIRLRAFRETDGYEKLANIRHVLTTQMYAVGPLVVQAAYGTGTATYIIHAFTKPGQVLSLGKEAGQSKRQLFTLNFTVPIRRTA